RFAVSWYNERRGQRSSRQPPCDGLSAPDRATVALRWYCPGAQRRRPDSFLELALEERERLVVAIDWCGIALLCFSGGDFGVCVMNRARALASPSLRSYSACSSSVMAFDCLSHPVASVLGSPVPLLCPFFVVEASH